MFSRRYQALLMCYDGCSISFTCFLKWNFHFITLIKVIEMILANIQIFDNVSFLQEVMRAIHSLKTLESFDRGSFFAVLLVINTA